MSTIGTIEITYSVDCKACGYTARGGSIKRAYLWLALHLRTCEETALAHPESPHTLWSTIKVLWQLWRWKP